jgi:hypothetical protein
MAIICLGEVLAQGNPIQIVEEMKGKIWKKLIEKKEIEQYRKDLKVISTHLSAGKTQIHVVSDNQPDSSFEPAEADLEDVYFSTISQKVDVITI